MLSSTEETRLAAQYAKGKTLRQLADKFGVSPAAARSVVIRKNGQLRPRGRVAGVSPYRRETVPF